MVPQKHAGSSVRATTVGGAIAPRNTEEELTTLIEELKKTKVQEVIFSTSEGEDIEREYIDPIPSLDLTTSSDSEQRIEPATKADLSQKIEVLSFGTNIA